MPLALASEGQGARDRCGRTTERVGGNALQNLVKQLERIMPEIGGTEGKDNWKRLSVPAIKCFEARFDSLG
jgi:hypothetical protein